MIVHLHPLAQVMCLLSGDSTTLVVTWQNMIDFEDDGDIKNINGSYGTISSDERVKENM